MKRPLAMVMAGLLVCQAPALSNSDRYIIGQNGVLSLTPLYQQWSLDQGKSFTAVSLVMGAYFPLGREMSLALRGARSNTRGDVTGINAFSDTQISLRYHLEALNLLLSCGVNIPTGKKQLTDEEFETSLLLSNDVLRLQVPNYGQGFNISPGFTVAFPVSDWFVVGAGASYQYRGKYHPLSEQAEYDPGDEFLLTAGFDMRLSESSAFAADVIFTTYGKDKIGGAEVYMAGNKWIGNAQFRQYLAKHELWIFTRYRAREKNEIAIAGSQLQRLEKIYPDETDVFIHFVARVSDPVSLRFMAEGRFFQATPSMYSGVDVYGIGLAPEIRLATGISLPLRAKYQFGKLKTGSRLSGFEVGAGISFTL